MQLLLGCACRLCDIQLLLQAVCQMVMGGNSVFEEALLKLDTPDPDDAVQARAVAMLDMFCLDSSGENTLVLMLHWLTSLKRHLPRHNVECFSL